jgi:hypothetical protein
VRVRLAAALEADRASFQGGGNLAELEPAERAGVGEPPGRRKPALGEVPEGRPVQVDRARVSRHGFQPLGRAPGEPNGESEVPPQRRLTARSIAAPTTDGASSRAGQP